MKIGPFLSKLVYESLHGRQLGKEKLVLTVRGEIFQEKLVDLLLFLGRVKIEPKLAFLPETGCLLLCLVKCLSQLTVFISQVLDVRRD